MANFIKEIQNETIVQKNAKRNRIIFNWTPLLPYIIKIDGKDVGRIAPPSWSSNNKQWVIRLTINKKDINEDGNPNCSWKWVELVKRFDTEESAREYLKENKDKIFGNLDLYYSE
jgi:hypothetical protein